MRLQLQPGTRWRHVVNGLIYQVMNSGEVRDENAEVIAWSEPDRKTPGIGGYAWRGEVWRFAQEFQPFTGGGQAGRETATLH